MIFVALYFLIIIVGAILLGILWLVKRGMEYLWQQSKPSQQAKNVTKNI
jgi:hypothetical protein